MIDRFQAGPLTIRAARSLTTRLKIILRLPILCIAIFWTAILCTGPTIFQLAPAAAEQPVAEGIWNDDARRRGAEGALYVARVIWADPEPARKND
jgi:hypothetical protein